MKNVLALVGNDAAEPVLEAALLVARRFSGHITGLHSLSSEYADNFGWEAGFSISPDLSRDREREGHERRDRAASVFRKFMTARRVALDAGPAEHTAPTASWFEDDIGRRSSGIGTIGRAYDLIVVQQPGRLGSLAGVSFEHALFESGRPILVVPQGNAPGLGDVVAIAWNGSTETAQAVALGMPFLKQAKRVVIVAIDIRHMPEPGPSGEELARSLERHGLNVSLRTAVGRQRRQGESYLREAADSGADLLLKGAYTRSRLRQTIFGGATRHIILASAIPVLMAR